MNSAINSATSLPFTLTDIIGQYLVPDTIILHISMNTDGYTVEGVYRSLKDAVANKDRSSKHNFIEVIVGKAIPEGVIWVYTWYHNRYVRYDIALADQGQDISLLPDITGADLTDAWTLHYTFRSDDCPIGIDLKWSYTP